MESPSQREILVQRLAAYVKNTPFEAALAQYLEAEMAVCGSDAALVDAMVVFFDEHVPPEIKRKLYEDIDRLLQ